MHFKMRQFQRKVTPNKEQTLIVTNGRVSSPGKASEQSSAEWEEIDFEPIIKESERINKGNNMY